MKYPENLKIGDAIGICAPSDGIVNQESIIKLEQAMNNLKTLGYKVIETESVRNSSEGRSASAEQRVKEFMELLENDEVKLIIFASGGDFLIEILPYLNWEYLKKIKPKWIQGYSDITGIEFLWNTILDIPSIYCQNIKDYAMNPLYKNLVDALEFAKGNNPIQNSYPKHEKVDFSLPENKDYTYKLTEKTTWKNIFNEKEITIEGRIIGGCLDVIQCIFGTEFDKIKEYIEKYKEDGILWYLECFDISTSELYRKLWQMQYSGYFKHCKGIIFGRPLFMKEEYEIDEVETIKRALAKLNIPIITRSRYWTRSASNANYKWSNS